MGIEKQILKAGTGPKPVRGQTVTVHCTGFVKNRRKICVGRLLEENPIVIRGVSGQKTDRLGESKEWIGKDRDLSKKFWSTKDPGQQPFTFQIGFGNVIKGWDEGVLDMQMGEIARLECSPDYAYGASGFPAWGIQPNSVLVFEIEVLGAK